MDFTARHGFATVCVIFFTMLILMIWQRRSKQARQASVRQEVRQEVQQEVKAPVQQGVQQGVQQEVDRLGKFKASVKEDANLADMSDHLLVWALAICENHEGNAREYLERFNNLRGEFSKKTDQQLMSALVACQGHAGKAKTLLIEDRGEGIWSTDNGAFEICKQGEENTFQGRAAQLRTGEIEGVRAVVQSLNEGILACPEGICVVWSVSRNAYFLLFRADKREEAATAFPGRDFRLKG